MSASGSPDILDYPLSLLTFDVAVQLNKTRRWSNNVSCCVALTL